MSTDRELIDQIERMERSSKAALPFTAVGIAAVLIALFVGAFQLNRAQAERRALLEEIQVLEERKAELLGIAARIEREIADLQDQVGDLAAQATNVSEIPQADETSRQYALLELKGEADRIQQSLAFANQSLYQVTGTVSRVFFHIGEESQRTAAQRLGIALRQQTGVLVPGVERIDTMPRNSELRYLRRADASEAQSIGAALVGLGLPVEVKYVAGHEDNPAVRARTFELWIARDADLTAIAAGAPARK